MLSFCKIIYTISFINVFMNKLLLWILIWGIVWLGYDFLKKHKINFVDNFFVTLVYFLIVDLTLIYFFKNDLIIFFKDVTMSTIFFFVLVILFYFLLYHITRKHRKISKTVIKKYPWYTLLRIDYKFLISKPFEILFQQLCVLLLITWLMQYGFVFYQILIVFGILFGLSHLRLLFESRNLFTYLFIVTALIGSIVLPYLIVYVKNGAIYSYLIHYGYYTLLGTVYWFSKPKEKKRKKRTIQVL